jgi:hypothetical protein
MAWIIDFIAGMLVWLIAVASLPLLLVVGVYIYIEGAPEITKFLDRTIGRALHLVISAIREVIQEIAKIKLIGIIKSIWMYALAFIVLYLLLRGAFDMSYVTAMMGALIENTAQEWSGMVIFWSLGVIVLVIKVADFSYPFLSLAMFFFPLILTMSTLTLVGMMGSTRGGAGLYRRGANNSASSSKSGGGQAAVVGGLRGLISGGLEGASQVASVRPLLFMIGSFYFGIQGMLSHAFVLCTIAALVEISNEQWFETAAFVSLAMMVLVAQAADMDYPLLVATMFALPLVIALATMAPRSPTKSTSSSSSSSVSSPKKDSNAGDYDTYLRNDDERTEHDEATHSAYQYEAQRRLY